MGKKKYSGFTKETTEHLLLDAGAFFRGFIYTPGGENNDTFDKAVAAGKLIGATKGGGEFLATAKLRKIEVDGAPEYTKGLETIDSWEVYLKATVLETTAETIKQGLGIAAVDKESDDTYYVIKGKTEIEDSDYQDNVTWVGKISGSDKPVIIVVKNALSTDGLKITLQDKNEATIPLTFYGHYEQDKLEEPPFEIYYPKPAAAQTATQTTTDSTKE